MRCIFCKNDSSTSVSREHIIPESLGNTMHTLPPGVVCDACNNYFSRKVEKPFLESDSVRALRFEQALVSKKGKIPSLTGIITPIEAKVTLTRFPSGPIVASVDTNEEALGILEQSSGGHLIFPSPPGTPSGAVVSRFLAKIAVEAMAFRLLQQPEGLAYLADERQLDLIRDHARRGYTPNWPYHARPIYKRDQKWVDSFGSETQILHEFDVLATEWGEWFLVVAVFGIEFAINYGGPEIDGYLKWMKLNDYVSPLYSGKNA
jgi:hypothetical protein